jgi:hypothetical protein
MTITGTSLTGATSVTVGGVAATSVVVVSSISITAVTPAGTAGANSVAVTTPSGSATSAFIYVVPTDGYTVLEQYVDAAVVTNVTMRNAITASGLPWRVRDTGTNIEMLLVPAGTFTMGCSASTQYGCYSDESPAHQVTLSAFYIGRYEVTQAQWTAKMGSNPSYFSGYSDSPSRPVERVSWNMHIAPEQQRRFTVFLDIQVEQTTTHFLATLRGTQETMAHQDLLPMEQKPWAASLPTRWAFTTCQEMFGSGAKIGMGFIHQVA